MPTSDVVVVRLSDFDGDVVAWSLGSGDAVIRSSASEFELEVPSGLRTQVPALIGLAQCSGSVKTINGEQHLLHCVTTCLARPGEKFDPPLLLRFPVGDEDSTESGSLDGNENAEVAYRAHLESTFSVFKRHDAGSEWVPIHGDIVRTEGGDLALEMKITHFCDFGVGQKLNAGYGVAELVELPKLVFKSSKTHYHFVNLGTSSLVVHVWGAGRKEGFTTVAKANVGVDATSGLTLSGEVERIRVDVPGSGPFKVDLPGRGMVQVCRQFIGLESPTAAWTTQDRIAPSSGAEGHELVQVWGKTDIKQRHVLVLGPMQPGVRPDLANLKVKDGEHVGRLVWSKMECS